MVDTRRFLSLLLLFLLLCNSCKPEPYKKFIPEDESPFKISFEYPSDWEFFTHDLDYFLGYDESPSFISFLTNFPTLYKKYEESISRSNPPQKFSNIVFIDVWVDDPGGKHTAYGRLLETLSALRSLPERQKMFTILEDHQIKIGEMPAIEMVFRQESYLNFDDIFRDIFILDGDRYYSISIHTYENDPDQTFLQEVNRLIESIEKVP